MGLGGGIVVVGGGEWGRKHGLATPDRNFVFLKPQPQAFLQLDMSTGGYSPVATDSATEFCERYPTSMNENMKLRPTFTKMLKDLMLQCLFIYTLLPRIR